MLCTHLVIYIPWLRSLHDGQSPSVVQGGTFIWLRLACSVNSTAVNILIYAPLCLWDCLWDTYTQVAKVPPACVPRQLTLSTQPQHRPIVSTTDPTSPPSLGLTRLSKFHQPDDTCNVVAQCGLHLGRVRTSLQPLAGLGASSVNCLFISFACFPFGVAGFFSLICQNAMCCRWCSGWLFWKLRIYSGVIETLGIDLSIKPLVTCEFIHKKD